MGAFLASSPGVAVADVNSGQAVSVEIFPSSGAPKTESITLAELEANCTTTYPGPNVELYRNGSQVPGQQVTQKAWSLADVLGCLSTPVAVREVTGVTVVQSGGVQSSPLLPADLASPSDFATSSEVPVIFSDGSNIIYDRPWRGGSDNNADDQVTESNPSPLTIEVFQGPLLTITATASQTSVPAGTTVNFSASVKGVSGTPSYSWNFDGGAANSTVAGPQVSFPNAGTYRVTVLVTDSAGGGGAAAIPITVTSATTPTTPAGNTPHGPAGTNGNKPGAPKGNGHSPTSGKPGGKKSAASGKHKRATHTTTTTPASTGTTSTSSSTPNPSATTTHHRTPAPSRHHAAPGTTSSSSLVRGRLISNVTPLPAAESPLVHAVPAAVASAPAVRRAISASVLPALASGLAVILLFGIGAGRELRWRPIWRLPGLGN